MSERDTKPGGRRVRVTPWSVLWGVLAFVAIVLLAQNSTDTSVHFFWLSIQAPLFVVIGAALLIGWGLGELGSRVWRWRRKDRGDR